MKNNFEAAKESGLNIFISNQSLRFNSTMRWGNNEIEPFLMLTKKLNVTLLYAYIQEDEHAESVLKELGFHYNDIFHYFAPIPQNVESPSDQDEFDEEDSPGAKEEKDLEAFLGTDTTIYISEITSVFRDGKVSRCSSINEILEEFWESHGIEYDFRFYEKEVLNKLRTINMRVIGEYLKESSTFQKALLISEDFKSNALDFFKKKKFKSIKKIHLHEYLTSMDILLTLTPLTEDSLLNLINDGLKISIKK